MSKNLFQKPVQRLISGIEVHVYKVPFEVFEDAVVFGRWLISQGGAFDPEVFEKLTKSDPVVIALERLLCACIATPGEQDEFLSLSDVRTAPIPTVVEAVYVVLEENLDFFLTTLEAVRPIQQRLTSIGSSLRNS